MCYTTKNKCEAQTKLILYFYCLQDKIIELYQFKYFFQVYYGRNANRSTTQVFASTYSTTITA